MNIQSVIHGLVSRVKNALIPYSRRGVRFYGAKIAGVPVTYDSAMTLAAVYRAVSYISDMLMVLPWNVFEQGQNFSSVRRQNSLDWILNQQVNNELDARSWRGAMVRYALTRGNAFAEIARDNRGAVSALGYPIDPGRVTIYRDTDSRQLIYRIYTGDLFEDSRDQHLDLPASRMYHLKGPGDGYMGMSVIAYAARTIGIGLAQESNISSFFANGSRTSGVLEYPGKMSPEGRDNLGKYLEEQMKGPSNAFNLLVLEQGMKWSQVGIPNDDAQMLQSREFTVLDIARWFNLPPYVLQDYSRATWNNIEHASTEAVLSGLLPWAIRMETEANIKLIAEQNRRRLRTKINLKGLLRADTATRNAAYAQGRQWGWLSANDVRALEDLEPIEGGDVYLSPMNMVPADQVGRPQPTETAREDKFAKTIIGQMWETLVSREMTEVARHDDADWIENWHEKSRTYYEKTVERLQTMLNAVGLQYVGDVGKGLDEYQEESYQGLSAAHDMDDMKGYVGSKEVFVRTLTDEWLAQVEVTQ